MNRLFLFIILLLTLISCDPPKCDYCGDVEKFNGDWEAETQWQAYETRLDSLLLLKNTDLLPVLDSIIDYYSADSAGVKAHAAKYKVEKIKQKKQSVYERISHFNASVFGSLFDSLVSGISGRDVKADLIIDTIMWNHGLYPYMDSARHTYVYHFRPVKPDGLPGITVNESAFTDEAMAERVFDWTRMMGSRNYTGKPIAPAGHTYVNDFIFHYHDKIIALNVPCSYSYSYENYQKLLFIFRRAFKMTLPADPIRCKRMVL